MHERAFTEYVSSICDWIGAACDGYPSPSLTSTCDWRAIGPPRFVGQGAEHDERAAGSVLAMTEQPDQPEPEPVVEVRRDEHGRPVLWVEEAVTE